VSELPYPPGTSPFRIKGNVYRYVKEIHQEWVPGGVASVEAALDDAQLRDFYRTSFLAGGWYDYLPLVLIESVAAELMGTDGESYLTAAGRRLADRDLGGLYRLLLRFTSPENAMERMAGVYRQYYNFGRSEVTLIEGGAEARIHGMPAIVVQLYRTVATAFVIRLVELAGAKKPRGEWTDPVPCGTQDGVPLVSASSVLRWKR